ncbi:SPOR domain-containing protein [Belliella sp. R4-6]|uniref:SPOR domain-containing protein n=1 Tax=Belliella alkalica TaxID=1730871 RepID=A0ABS9V784_9BACT|nr:SPOR domain-containing protein [Belliella alkalica]MCH7412280.1 SPOR domain-containing protein [Belliella alkalica]
MKENKNNIDDQDKDYGFPFVELVPLNDLSENIDEIVGQEQQIESIEEVESQQIPTKVIESTIIEQKPEAKKQINEHKIVEKKKSTTPMVIGLVLLMLVVLGSMAYFLYYVPNSDQGKVSESIEANQEPEEVSSLVTAEIDTEDNVEEETAEVEEEEIIAATTEPELTIINSREASPRYFIVVGSVVAERYARQEVQQYLEKGHDTWIIFPYGDIKNYRIAVGKFDNIETATEAWEKAKGEFGDAIWILKY